jgi:hypothetical protein
MATINLNDSSPANPPGKQNNKWQAAAATNNPRDISSYTPDFVADSGTGGLSGAVPAPQAGDSAEGKFLSAKGWFPLACQFDFFLPGTQTLANQIFKRFIPAIAFTVPSGLTRSTFTATANATGTTIFSVQKNDVEFGTITVAAGGVSALFAAASSTSFNGKTDILSVVGPAAGDATLANIGIIISGTPVIENRLAQFDEDFWINPVRPVPASMYRSPLFRDPEEVPAGVLLKSTSLEEGYWQNRVRPVVTFNRPFSAGDPGDRV